MSAVTAAPPVASSGGLARFVADSLVLTRRSLLRYRRDPQTVAFLLVQPVMFILLFRYVFGGSIEVPGLDYVDFLVPGIIAQSVSFSMIGTAVTLAEDLTKGITDRFRSLPMNGLAVLAGRVLATSAITTASIVFMTAVGYLVGFRISTGIVPALLALVVLVSFGFAFTWISVVIGLRLGSVEAVQSAGFVWLFPLNFVSSVFVDPATFPGPMRAFAAANPISLVVNVARGLTVGGPVAPSMPGLIAWLVGILVVFTWLSNRAWKQLG